MLTLGHLSNQANMIKVQSQQKNYSHKNPKAIQIRARIVTHTGLRAEVPLITVKRLRELKNWKKELKI